MAKKRYIFLSACRQLHYGFSRNHQNVFRSYRIDIPKSNSLFVFVYYVSWNFLSKDFSKYRVLWLKLILFRRFCSKFSFFSFIAALPIGAKLSYKHLWNDTKSCTVLPT